METKRSIDGKTKNCIFFSLFAYSDSEFVACCIWGIFDEWKMMDNSIDRSWNLCCRWEKLVCTSVWSLLEKFTTTSIPQWHWHIFLRSFFALVTLPNGKKLKGEWRRQKSIDQLTRNVWMASPILSFPFFCPSRSESKMIFLLWCKTSIMLCVQQKKSKIKALPSPNWVTSKLLSQQLPHRLETDPCHRIKLINFAPSTVEWEKRWEGRENCDVSSKPSYVHSQQHKHTFFSGKS